MFFTFTTKKHNIKKFSKKVFTKFKSCDKMGAVKNKTFRGEIIMAISVEPMNRETSPMAKKLESMSDASAFNRYFTKGDKTNYLKDVSKAASIMKRDARGEETEYIYKILISMMGKPNDYVFNKILNTLNPYIPEGYTIDAANLCQDLEAMYAENKGAIMAVIAATKSNAYLKSCIDLIVETCIRAIEYKTNLNV